MTRQSRITVITVVSAVAVVGLFIGLVFALAPGSSSSSPAQAQASQAPWTRDLTAVEGDLHDFTMDASSEDASAAQEDGLRLTTDATKAENMPPPADAADYKEAMAYYVQAGQNAQMAYWPATGTLMHSGDSYLKAWSTASHISINLDSYSNSTPHRRCPGHGNCSPRRPIA